jgi:signal transduction histidine kinase/ligand-binding sensor domain-containing protein/CheY-like chemotaxis protein/AraC-like DNA-binding protein
MLLYLKKTLPFAILLFLILSNTQVYSVISNNQINFKQISLKEGLSQSTVYDIKQDQLGYIWIATTDGLNRYDGYKFVVYRHDENDENSLPSNSITSLLIDNDGDLWIGTDGGLAKYNHELNSFKTFATNDKVARLRVFSMQKWKDEEIYLMTNAGLFSFNEQKGFKKLNFPAVSFGVTALLKIGDKMLIGADRGLYFYFPRTNTFTLVNKEFEGKRIQSMLPENLEKKRIWIGTEGSGLYLFDITKNKFLKFSHEKNNPLSISSDYIRSLCYDFQQRLWIGTFVGLNIYNPTNNSFTRFYNNYQDIGTISQNSIRSIYSDSQGGLWFGTYYGGLNYYHPLKNQFQHLYYVRGYNSLNDNVVSAMLAEPNGNVWIGTNDKGLDLYITKSNQFEHFTNDENNPHSLSGNNIKALLKVDNGNLLVGTHGGGLNYFHVKARSFDRINISSDPMINDNVYGLVKNKKGEICIGTLNGLIIYNQVTKQVIPFTQLVPKSKKMNTKILSLFCDTHDQLWIGTDNGAWVYSFRNGNFLKLSSDGKGKTEKIIYCFFKSSLGRIWVGTNEGLFYFDKNKLISYKEKVGFPSFTICSIQEDQFKQLWISTNRGLISLSTDSEKWRIYTESDGIQSNQFNHYSSCKTADDKMFFGGINGITVFSPERLIDNPYSPTPIINQLTVFNKIVTPNDNTKILEQSIELSKSIKIPPQFNVFGLEFVVPNFLAGTKNSYSYTLEGFDKEWYTNEKNNVSYSNLAPGKYLFKVKAANNNGRWSLDETQLEIEILPYWYNTWLAKLIFFSLIIGIVIFLIRFYLSRQILSKELEFERVNSERIKEIDQAKIRFFVNVSHEFRTPLTLILSPVREMLERGVKEHKWAQHQLGLIERNAERMLHLVNQALDYRKTELGAMPLHVKQLELEPLVRKSFELFTQLAEKKNTEYIFNSTVFDQKLYVDPNYLERILTNLLSNAFKYSPKGGTITLNISISGKNTCIEVEDSGYGISKEKFGRIFDRFYQEDDNTQGTGIGLSLVKNLVEKHRGSISLDSEIGRGSKFTVLLPALKETYEENELSPKIENEIIDHVIKNNAKEEISYENLDSSLENDAANEIEIKNEEFVVKKKILLVEDDEEIRNYLAGHLSDKYNVLEAENGTIAWEILQQEDEIQLILSDLMMPILDGLTLCKMVKQNIHYCHIPFILLTAKNEVEHQLKGLKVGADDYMGKPFIYSIVEAKISNVFKQHQRIIRKYANSVEINTHELASTGLDEEFLSKAMFIIEKHMDNEDFSVEDFSSEMCMSRSGLHLKLKAITGESARDFIRKVKLNHACKLLKEGKYNLTEISELIGFTPAYFSTAFKKYTGYMPSEYLKNKPNQRD